MNVQRALYFNLVVLGYHVCAARTSRTDESHRDEGDFCAEHGGRIFVGCGEVVHDATGRSEFKVLKCENSRDSENSEARDGVLGGLNLALCEQKGLHCKDVLHQCEFLAHGEAGNDFKLCRSKIPRTSFIAIICDPTQVCNMETTDARNLCIARRRLIVNTGGSPDTTATRDTTSNHTLKSDPNANSDSNPNANSNLNAKLTASSTSASASNSNLNAKLTPDPTLKSDPNTNSDSNLNANSKPNSKLTASSTSASASNSTLNATLTPDPTLNSGTTANSDQNANSNPDPNPKPTTTAIKPMPVVTTVPSTQTTTPTGATRPEDTVPTTTSTNKPPPMIDGATVQPTRAPSTNTQPTTANVTTATNVITTTTTTVTTKLDTSTSTQPITGTRTPATPTNTQSTTTTIVTTTTATVTTTVTTVTSTTTTVTTTTVTTTTSVTRTPATPGSTQHTTPGTPRPSIPTTTTTTGKPAPPTTTNTEVTDEDDEDTTKTDDAVPGETTDGMWDEWAPCNATCGGGTRVRRCNPEAPLGAEQPCTAETEKCGEAPCEDDDNDSESLSSQEKEKLDVKREASRRKSVITLLVLATCFMVLLAGFHYRKRRNKARAREDLSKTITYSRKSFTGGLVHHDGLNKATYFDTPDSDEETRSTVRMRRRSEKQTPIKQVKSRKKMPQARVQRKTEEEPNKKESNEAKKVEGKKQRKAEEETKIRESNEAKKVEGKKAQKAEEETKIKESNEAKKVDGKKARKTEEATKMKESPKKVDGMKTQKAEEETKMKESNKANKVEGRKWQKAGAAVAETKPSPSKPDAAEKGDVVEIMPKVLVGENKAKKAGFSPATVAAQEYAKVIEEVGIEKAEMAAKADGDQFENTADITLKLMYTKYGLIAGRMLGMGAFGRVILAKNESTTHLLAVKEIAIASASEAGTSGMEEVDNELDHLMKMDHPNINAYKGHAYFPTRSNPTHLLIMLKYEPGGTIQNQLQQFGAFSDALIMRYTSQILAGILYLHSQDPSIVHRDLKPANLLLDAAGVVKIADFGCAKTKSIANVLNEGTMKGTVSYMAPEVFHSKEVGATQDIWSFGCIVWEMCTAEAPWREYGITNIMEAFQLIADGDKLPTAPKDRPASLISFIYSCLTRNPFQRQSAFQLSNHLMFTQKEKKAMALAAEEAGKK